MRTTITLIVASIVNPACTYIIRRLPDNKWEIIVLSIVLPNLCYVLGIWVCYRFDKRK